LVISLGLMMTDCRGKLYTGTWDYDTVEWKPGRPRKNWNNTIRKDLKAMVFTWKEAQQVAANTGLRVTLRWGQVIPCVTMCEFLVLFNSNNFVGLVTWLLGYWHQRADERHGNPPPM